MANREILRYNQPEKQSENWRPMAERRDDWPKLSLNFFFSPHSNDIDMENLNLSMQGSDVFFYEGVGSDEPERNFMNKAVSQARAPYVDIVNDEDLNIGGTHFEGIIHSLYGTGIAVSGIDVGRYDEGEYEYFIAGKSLTDKFMSQDYDFDQAKRMMYLGCGAMADMQSEREELMVQNFEREIDRILDERPDFKDKSELRVLIQMGSTHTSLARRFMREGFDVSREFSVRPYLFSYGLALERSAMYGASPSEDLVERALTTKVLQQVPMSVTERISGDEVLGILRKLVSNLSHDEMAEIYADWQAGELTEEYLAALFIYHDIEPMPWSRDDIQRELGRATRL